MVVICIHSSVIIILYVHNIIWMTHKKVEFLEQVGLTGGSIILLT